MASYAEIQSSLNSANRAMTKFAKENQRLVTIVLSVGGQGISGLLVGLTGYLERRFPMKDGTPMSFGPLPLTMVGGITTTIASALLAPGIGQNLLSHTAAGFWGAVGATYGRLWGATAKAKADAKKKGKKVKGVVGEVPARAIRGRRPYWETEDDEEDVIETTLSGDEAALLGYVDQAA